MKAFLTNLRKVAISGFFALFPLYVLLIIITKAWTHLSSVGAKIAAIFGIKSILGVGGTTVFSGLVLIAIWIVSGLLVRVSFVGALNRAVEKALSKYIPGYETYKTMAEEKLEKKVKVLPYASALIRWQEYWQPAYIVEQDQDGNCVVFLPDIPETNKERVLVAKRDEVRMVPSMTANQLDALLKKTGKGLLSECGIHTG
jgi:hypothetical protein